MKTCDVCAFPVDSDEIFNAPHVVLNCPGCGAIQIYSSLLLGKYVRDEKNSYGENGHVYELVYPLICSECNARVTKEFHKICMSPRLGYERYKLAVKDTIKPYHIEDGNE
jgi:hypothetical protein